MHCNIDIVPYGMVLKEGGGLIDSGYRLCHLKFAGELLIVLLGCSGRGLGELFLNYTILFYQW